MGEGEAGRSAWWVRLAAALPWWLLYGLADCLAWLAWRVIPYQADVVRGNLTVAFPELDPPELRQVMRRYYRGFGEVLVEVVKAARLPPAEIRRRVVIEGLASVR